MQTEAGVTKSSRGSVAEFLKYKVDFFQSVDAERKVRRVLKR